MNAGDQLLFTLSVRRSLNWAAFKRVVSRLSPQRASSGGTTFDAGRTIRLLDSLAYGELLRGESSLTVCPVSSGLAVLPVRTPTALLIGARVPETIDIVRRAAEQAGVTVTESIDDSADNLCPTRIQVVADHASSLGAIATALGVPYVEAPLAWRLALFSGSLETLAASLAWRTSPALNWPSADFDSHSLRFRPSGSEAQEHRLVRYTDPARGVFRYVLWDGSKSVEVNPDWGRFWCLSRTGSYVLYYDPNTQLFAVPRSLPLPKLLARALALCGGHAPMLISAPVGRAEFQWNAYSDVPISIAQLVSKKLEQKTQMARLDGGRRSLEGPSQGVSGN